MGLLQVTTMEFPFPPKTTYSLILPAHFPQVCEITKVAKERIELAKALVRASEKPTKTRTTNAGPKDKNGEVAGAIADADGAATA